MELTIRAFTPSGRRILAQDRTLQGRTFHNEPFLRESRDRKPELSTRSRLAAAEALPEQEFAIFGGRAAAGRAGPSQEAQSPGARPVVVPPRQKHRRNKSSASSTGSRIRAERSGCRQRAPPMANSRRRCASSSQCRCASSSRHRCVSSSCRCCTSSSHRHCVSSSRCRCMSSSLRCSMSSSRCCCPSLSRHRCTSRLSVIIPLRLIAVARLRLGFVLQESGIVPWTNHSSRLTPCPRRLLLAHVWYLVLSADPDTADGSPTLVRLSSRLLLAWIPKYP